MFPPSQSAHLYPVSHALGTMYSQVPREALSVCRVVDGAALDDAVGSSRLCPTLPHGSAEDAAHTATVPPPTAREKTDQRTADEPRTTTPGAAEPAGPAAAAAAAAAASAAACPLPDGGVGCGGSEGDAAVQPQEQSPRFPSLQQARGFKCIVRRGDMLYIPVGWWHSVSGSPEMNLTLNYW